MRRAFLLLLSIFVVYSVQSQTRWKADPAHSSIQFEVSHMTISTVSGKFTDFSCELEAKKNSFEGAKVEAKVEVESVSTENLTRDKHLREDDFFNAEQFPQMSFVSESFKKKDGDQYEVTGVLTIRDVSKKITFPATFSGMINMGNRTISGFKANFTINRFDYKLKWDDTLDTGSLVVGEDVDVTLNLELVKI
ncbi:Polyisoprenoid-binding protein YceI [Reichenbachiella faecimaris]|uniref:Polyisoprenoid-binding protein YceI n=1 Tax=Reichenbachiella faecimaris TaxID=692418 RepID=A0A1W2G7G4_REIFA|nr:YceI family protein [Reichenbachiella faecimaris]SMD32541.1 Polyisoprenoid-binding protein YceI [Reichenbachiella faecimaris]